MDSIKVMTKTSVYELSVDYGAPIPFKLKKIKMYSGAHSMVSSGREFLSQSLLGVRLESNHQLIFGDMITSPVRNHRQVSEWISNLDFC